MFKKYTSIENTYREEYIEKIKNHGFGNDLYIVQEKAHGANLSFWTTDGKDFQAAKRSGFIEEDETFFNHDKILYAISANLQSLWTDLQSQVAELHQLTVFGELVGGSYPHKEAPRVKDAIRTQKGIFYCPDNRFFAFDIRINEKEYLDVELASDLFGKHGFLYAKTLYEGSLSDCLSYPIDFDSVIPNDLGLPLITPNTVEGVVIKPKTNRYFNNGGRVIMKHKNEKWSEKSAPKREIHTEEPLSEQVVQLQQAIKEYVTENRLLNVISKIGHVTDKDFGKLLGMFSKDVVEDFLKDYKDETDTIEKKEHKAITKSFANQAKKLISKHLNLT